MKKAIILAVALFTNSVFAQEMINTEAIEAMHINIDMDGNTGKVTASECTGCETKTLVLPSNAKVLKYGKAVPVDESLDTYNVPGLVVYNPDTLTVISLEL